MSKNLRWNSGLEIRLGRICAYFWESGFWIRIFGHVLRVLDHRKNPPLFSERYGYRKGWHLGPYCFMLIKCT